MASKRCMLVSLLPLFSLDEGWALMDGVGVDSQSKSTIVNIAPPEESRVTDDWFADTTEEKRYG